MMIRLCIAFLLFAFAPAMAAEGLPPVAQQQTPLLEQLQIQLRQAETRAAEAERRERDAEIRRLEEEAREAGARASAAEQSQLAAQSELSIEQARTELQDQAYSRLEIITSGSIGFFGTLITIIVLIITLRTEKAAVTSSISAAIPEAVIAARKGVEDIREKLETRLSEAGKLLEQASKEIEALLEKASKDVEEIGNKKIQLETEWAQPLSIVDALKTLEDPQTVADAARAALAKPPRDRSATDYRAIIIEFLTHKKWTEVLHAAGQMRLLHEGNADFALARFSEGYALSQQGQHAEAIKAYDDVVARLCDASEAALRELVARALVNKSFSLRQLNRHGEAIAVYDDVVARFGSAPEAAQREVVAVALFNKGVTLGQLNRHGEAIAVYDDVVARFSSAPEAAIREQVAGAHYNKASVYARQGLADEAIKALRSMIGAGSPLDLEEIAKDADFDPVRNDPAFIKFLAENKG